MVLDQLAVCHTALGSWGAKFGQQIEDRCLARTMGSGERVDMSAFELQVNAIDGDKAFELFDEVSGCPYEFLAHVGGSVSFISNQSIGDFKSRSFHSGGFLQSKCQFGGIVIPWFVKQVSAAGLNTFQSTWFSMRCHCQALLCSVCASCARNSVFSTLP